MCMYVMGECFPLLQSLIEEQQSQLNQYESAAGQCVSELHKAQLQVQSLQNKIHDSETSNKVLGHHEPLAASVHLNTGSASLWNCPGGMDTILPN